MIKPIEVYNRSCEIIDRCGYARNSLDAMERIVRNRTTDEQTIKAVEGAVKYVAALLHDVHDFTVDMSDNFGQE